MTNRRQVLAAAGMLAAAAPFARLSAQTGGSAAASEADYRYDYLFAKVRPSAGAASQAAFVEHVRTAGAAAVKAGGGEAIGYLTPLIGWSSQHVAVLLRWNGVDAGREQAAALIGRHPSVLEIERSRLAPTIRPASTDLPRTTGIYTHRWFEIRTADIDEFVALSARAWPSFENEFASKVYGLFRAAQTDAERSAGTTRMLLNTQYDSHAVWEASRRPSSEPAELFERRGQLTLTTRVASLRFTPLT